MKFGLMASFSPEALGEDTEKNGCTGRTRHVAAAEDPDSVFWLTEQHFFAEIGHSAARDVRPRCPSERAGFGSASR